MSAQAEIANDVETSHFVSLSGVDIDLPVPPATDLPAFYFMAAHKSGSVLFYNIVEELARAAGRHEFALETELFKRGVGLTDCPLELTQTLERPGVLFHGFRTLWLLPYVRQFRASRKLVLVRDPRDICVSYFFSVAVSHTVPEQGKVRDQILKQRDQANQTNINDFVKSGRCDFIMANIRNYINVAKTVGNCRFFKYEDIIFEKRQWVSDINDELGLGLGTDVIYEIADRHDIRPEQDQVDKHIRHVTPGNYKDHLDDEVVSLIERKFSPVFDYFEYEKAT